MEKKKTKTIYIKYVIDQCKKCPFYDNGYYEGKNTGINNIKMNYYCYQIRIRNK